MNDLVPIFERIAAINPVPDEKDIPAHAMAATALLDIIDERAGTVQTQQYQTKPTEEPKRRRTSALVTAATFVGVIVIGGAIALTANQAEDVSPVGASQQSTDGQEVIVASEVLPRAMNDSMANTLSTDSRIAVARSAYDSNQPQRTDIVLYADPRPELFPDEQYLSRVIGLPGETIEARDGEVYVDDRILDEPYLKDSEIPIGAFGPITLGPDELWLMGDNRRSTIDSRTFGPILISLLRGKVTEIVSP